MTKSEKQLKRDSARVEIIAHKNAAKKVVKKVNEANKNLNELFDDNHFTVKLVLASKE